MTLIVGKMVAELISKKHLLELQTQMKQFTKEQRKAIISEKINRSSLLYAAVKHKSPEIVSFFLKDCEADPNDIGYENGLKCPCLWKASEQDDLETVKILINAGADVDAVNSLKTTSLFIACSRGNLNIVRYLWCHGADVNSTNHEGMTCLMASINHPNLCRYLIGVGAMINTINAYGDSALLLAIKSSLKETVMVLLDAGANPLFINHYGVNAVFLLAYMNLEIDPECFSSVYKSSKNCIAIALELLSCQKMVQKQMYTAYTHWKSAQQLRTKPETLRIYRCPTSFQSQFQQILPLLFDRDALVLKYLEFRLGANHPFTLDLIKSIVLNVIHAPSYVILFRFFIDLIRSSENEVFLGMSDHIADLLGTFYLKYSYLIARFTDILSSLVGYLEEMKKRLESMSEATKLSHASKVDFCHKIILDYVGAFSTKNPGRLEDLRNHLLQAVKLNCKGSKNATLLHYCIENKYSVDIAMLLMNCGANPNTFDDDGKKPVHYVVDSSEYRSKELIDFFLTKGLEIDRNFMEDPCLSCLLNKKNLLEKPLRFLNLQCLAARKVAQHSSVVSAALMPKPLQDLINAHSGI